MDETFKRSALRVVLAEKAQLVPDLTLQQLVLERGPGCAEAYILLELREARSAGDNVCAYHNNGRYTVSAAPLNRGPLDRLVLS